MDDDIEAVPIYKCDGKDKQPIVRPHENHDLFIEWEATWMESQFLHLDHWIQHPKSREHDNWTYPLL